MLKSKPGFSGDGSSLDDSSRGRSSSHLRLHHRDSPYYAQVVIDDILAAIDALEQFPLLGRTVPERPRSDFRELIKPPYRIVYRVDEAIHILTIFRASRRFPSELEPK